MGIDESVVVLLFYVVNFSFFILFKIGRLKFGFELLLRNVVGLIIGRVRDMIIGGGRERDGLIGKGFDFFRDRRG